MKRDAKNLFKTIEGLFRIKDLDLLLENILTEARSFLAADAGTIYLAARGFLYFSFVQNDTLFQNEDEGQIHPQRRLAPVDKASLAGYVAKTGEPIVIDDVYHIQTKLSFAFNPAFDQKTNYRTRSILGVPLKTRENEVVGVLQLINAKNENGEVVAFSMDDMPFITQFAQNAADALEKARLSREMVLRMVEMAELRDPFETSRHAKRVGAYSVELYEKWATKLNVSSREIRKVRDVLQHRRHAARRGQGGGKRRHPQEARRAHLRREAEDEGAHGARRAAVPPHELLLGLHGGRGGAQPPRELGRVGLPGETGGPLRGEDLHGAREAEHRDPPVRTGRGDCRCL